MMKTRLSGVGGSVTTLAFLVLLQAARAQIEPSNDDGVEDLTTPMDGETCGYASCLPIKPGWLNVHIVPQTHSELGHGYNFHQHYTGEDPPLPKNTINMKRILDAVLTELWKDDSRKFTISDTAYLFYWWNNRHPAVHRMVHELIRQGRLTIVGGALSISDEASTSYHAVIDQYTYSLRKLNETFRACGRPLVAWAADVYGHSREFTSIMAQMGYDALFINPISYDEEMARLQRKSSEFLWRGSDDLGSVTDLFTHNLFDGYWAPPGFCFSKICSDPLLVTSSRLFSDVRERVDKFIETVLYRQAPNFETRNIMVIMGHRKAYSDAEIWFANIEKLITFTNWRAHQKKQNVTMFYSNPACYLSAVHDEKPELETKQDDFFPYVHDKDSYTVGMFTSRPTFKYLIREAHIYLQIAKQLQISANMGPYVRLFDNFNWLIGVVQDHSVATGVLRERVKKYYTAKLDIAINNATEMISKAFTKLRASPKHIVYYRCQFNISSCIGTRYIKYIIQVYNPLAWHVTTPVRLPIYPHGNRFIVHDQIGEEVKSVTVKLPDTILRIKGRPTADHELVFMATDLPPVGFRSYYVEAEFTHKGRRKLSSKRIDQDYNDLPNLYAQDKAEMRQLGSNTIRNVKKRNVEAMGGFVNKKKRITNASEILVTKLNGTSNYKRNVIQVDDDEKSDTYEVKPSMLRDFLQSKKVLNKLDFIDTERELLSSNELEKYGPRSDTVDTTTTEGNREEEDIKVPFKKHRVHSPDIMVEPDIKITILKHSTKKPVIGTQDSQRDLKILLKTTTESDIRVPKYFHPEPDIKVVMDTDIEVPLKGQLRAEPDVSIEDTNTEVLGLVSVTASEGTFSANWSTTESISVVPAITPATDIMINEPAGTPTTDIMINVPAGTPATDLMMNIPKFNLSSFPWLARRINQHEIIENGTESADPSIKENALALDMRRQGMPHDLQGKLNSNLNTVDTNDVDAYSQNGDIDQIEADRLRAVSDIEAEALTESSYTFSLTGSPSVVPTRTTPAPNVTKEKYFKVDDGSRLFIGNRYIRVNLDKEKRVASVFLRNGVRIKLGIQMFHYVSDDPDKFDVRTVPRRTIKPPGAYIFRPIDPYIIRAEDKYDIRITKTDIVDELHLHFNNWTSMSLRVYVDSPVIEVHWLVGPIPTQDGLGKDVFIRYQTNLDHDAAFYTDSNGRQMIKRIRGVRATYEPVDLHPITGNLYPVTSKIHIEDLRKNIRFAVFNDRCQAGGALIDGAIDLMVHRRILTDDIGLCVPDRYVWRRRRPPLLAVPRARTGLLRDAPWTRALRTLNRVHGFGAFLNETESDEPIRAAGVHYLYFTKANRNKIFEKKFAKEVAFSPRVLTSNHVQYSENMRQDFYNSKNEFTALNDKLPLGIHLLTLERLSKNEMLVRLENYLEKVDVATDGVRYVPLRHLFRHIKVVWLKETLLAANMYKDQWTPTQWRKKNKFLRSFNEYYGGGNATVEEDIKPVKDELGGRGIRLAPQQIRTFIVKYEYIQL